MNDFEHLVRAVKRRDRQVAHDVLTLSSKILRNIVEDPANPTYWHLSTKSTAFRNAIDQCPEFSEMLVLFGFRKSVVEFVERWNCQRPSTITVAKFRDYIDVIEEALPHVQPKSVVQIDMKEAKQRHRDYVDRMLLQAEEDRLEKIEIERIRNQKLKAAQENQRREQERAMQTTRELLKKSPTRQSDTDRDNGRT